ncbi:hypothetical protein PAPYR_8037 [Paratrimastix pyriformis]|uniref:Uncharacterized protein n=1 Tax=Paratrimastix pyriformis TaxID=342808 RepID=A0ABQ8UFK5_9EUKA|nr:hypothetical protein PAPYR_8037 [Paratrimastix pyriformis]
MASKPSLQEGAKHFGTCGHFNEDPTFACVETPLETHHTLSAQAQSRLQRIRAAGANSQLPVLNPMPEFLRWFEEQRDMERLKKQFGLEGRADADVVLQRILQNQRFVKDRENQTRLTALEKLHAAFPYFSEAEIWCALKQSSNSYSGAVNILLKLDDLLQIRRFVAQAAQAYAASLAPAQVFTPPASAATPGSPRSAAGGPMSPRRVLDDDEDEEVAKKPPVKRASTRSKKAKDSYTPSDEAPSSDAGSDFDEAPRRKRKPANKKKTAATSAGDDATATVTETESPA